MTTTRKRAIGEVALVIAGWALVQPVLFIIDKPMSGPVAYSILGGLVAGGVTYIGTRSGTKSQHPLP